MTITNLAAALIGCLLAAAVGEAQTPAPEAGLETVILLLDDCSQQIRPVSEDRTFLSDERIRFSVRPAESGFLYILSLTSQGRAKLLHPSAIVDNHVDRGRTATVPQQGWFRFDHNPGTERVYLLLSDRPLKPLDRVLTNGAELTAAAVRWLVTASRAPTEVRAVRQFDLRHD